MTEEGNLSLVRDYLGKALAALPREAILGKVSEAWLDEIAMILYQVLVRVDRKVH